MGGAAGGRGVLRSRTEGARVVYRQERRVGQRRRYEPPGVFEARRRGARRDGPAGERGAGRVRRGVVRVRRPHPPPHAWRCGGFWRLGGGGVAGAALLGSGALGGCGGSSSGSGGITVASWDVASDALRNTIPLFKKKRPGRTSRCSRSPSTTSSWSR